MGPIMKPLLNLAWSLMVMTVGVALGFTLFPYLFLDKPLSWSLSNATTAWLVAVALAFSVYFSFAYESWTRGDEASGGVAAGEAHRFPRLGAFSLPVGAFICANAALAAAGVFGLVFEPDLGFPLALRMGLGLLEVAGGAFALLVAIWLMVTWLGEPGVRQGRAGEGRSEDSGLPQSDHT